LQARLGVFALDAESGRTLAHRADERFALCSTFKWALAAAVLARADRAPALLQQTLGYGADDLLEHAPATRASLAVGSMSVEALAEAVVTVSDNTAANLLLAWLGGPAALTAFWRGLGDDVTRLDRIEPDLNANLPGDPRDTTSPRAMAHSLARTLGGEVLSAPARERLVGWMRASQTGLKRLRAGLPASWQAGDKTGTGWNGAAKDVAIAFPPGGGPVAIAGYVSGGDASLPERNAAHAEVGRIVADWVQTPPSP
jgi:beta-lactamase class A